MEGRPPPTVPSQHPGLVPFLMGCGELAGLPDYGSGVLRYPCLPTLYMHKVSQLVARFWETWPESDWGPGHFMLQITFSPGTWEPLPCKEGTGKGFFSWNAAGTSLSSA